MPTLRKGVLVENKNDISLLEVKDNNSIAESTMWNFWHSMATNWSIMAARAQLEQVKLEEFNLKSMKSTEDQSTTYILIQSFMKQLTLIVKQRFFHACNKSDQLQLRSEHHYTPIFALPWQCDIMEYSSVSGRAFKNLKQGGRRPGGRDKPVLLSPNWNANMEMRQQAKTVIFTISFHL